MCEIGYLNAEFSNIVLPGTQMRSEPLSVMADKTLA